MLLLASAMAAADGLAEVTRTVENPSADCAVVPDPRSAATTLLPDPFTGLDGKRITSRSEWRCRRQEILQLAEVNTHGARPAAPASTAGELTATSLRVEVGVPGRRLSFSASITLPKGKGPFPAVISYGHLAALSDRFLNEGVALIEMDPYQLGSEASRSPKQGAFYELYGADSATGLLVAWSWGVSRIIDVLEQQWDKGNRLIVPERIGVTGCSRFGKGAFTAGVFDARIVLTIPVESGSGGTPAWRSIATEEGAQPLASAYGEAPWFGDAFGRFAVKPELLPLDTHELIGTLAPRGLLVLEQTASPWLGIRSSHLANLAGAEIYKALGVGDALTYVATGDSSHCRFSEPWAVPLTANIRRFLHNENVATGGLTAAPGFAADLEAWRAWTTPDLTGKSY